MIGMFRVHGLGFLIKVVFPVAAGFLRILQIYRAVPHTSMMPGANLVYDVEEMACKLINQVTVSVC